MKYPKHVVTNLLLACVLYGVYTQDAHAYLDPGTGSYVIQLLVAFVLAAILFVKMRWTQIKGFIGRLQRKRTHDE
jgi:hypothetical protein